MVFIKNKLVNNKDNKLNENNKIINNSIIRKSISYDSIQNWQNTDDITIFFNPIQFKNKVYIEKNLQKIENTQDNIELTSKNENENENENEIFIDIELDNYVNEVLCIDANANLNTSNIRNNDLKESFSINIKKYSFNSYITSFREKMLSVCYICFNFRFCGCNPFAYIVFFPLNSILFIRKNKIVILNHLISIFLHIFLMIIFEIYFYFNYVIVIEKDVFLKKINYYFNNLEQHNHNKYSPLGISLFINETTFYKELDAMYKNYELSLIAQKNLLSKLLYQSCKLAAIFGLILVILWFFGLCYYNNIKWKGIIIDNILMLGLLGCFEYIFFTTIIMNYNPITDAELEYLIFKNIYTYITSNNTEYNIT